MITIPAYTKVNLTLEVLGRRSDGYHEVCSILQAIDLGDTIHFELDDELRLLCHYPSPGEIMAKAARLLQEESGSGRGAVIHVQEGIPHPSGGLGGSSSAAAATLKGLNELWGLGLKTGELAQIASRIGADCAFFLYGGTALGEGRGERITPLPSIGSSWVVLLRPPIDIPEKTKTLYGSLTPSHFTSGEATRMLVEHLRRGEEVTSSMLYNVFDRVAFDVFPGLGDYERCFSEAGASGIHLAGCGPSLFTLVGERGEGRRILSHLRSEGLEAYLSETI